MIGDDAHDPGVGSLIRGLGIPVPLFVKLSIHAFLFSSNWQPPKILFSSKPLLFLRGFTIKELLLCAVLISLNSMQ